MKSLDIRVPLGSDRYFFAHQYKCEEETLLCALQPSHTVHGHTANLERI